jgi:hypothetical protein
MVEDFLVAVLADGVGEEAFVYFFYVRLLEPMLGDRDGG